MPFTSLALSPAPSLSPELCGLAVLRGREPTNIVKYVLSSLPFQMDINWISQHNTGIPTRARRQPGCPDPPPALYQSSNYLLIAPWVPQEHVSAMTASKFLASVSVSPPVPKGWWHIFPLLKRSMITVRQPVNSCCCWGKYFHKNSSCLLTLLMDMQFINDMTQKKPEDFCWRQSDFSSSNKKRGVDSKKFSLASDVFNKSNGCARCNWASSSLSMCCENDIFWSMAG